ncbi:serine hydrolase domain-containing protein [Arsukibacterium perlucidum]|uniref:serine hydrolase domain-containing protein n=1 Tax=Arsukibacterium perlucidum TaxID=368811 RepID=UPI00036372C6|nr:serine hydrolase domain-containing protein [Arsukibacterium perlucidum]
MPVISYFSFRFLLLLCLVPFVSPVASVETDLETEISRAISEEALVGISWSIISDNQTSVGGAGFANVEQGLTMQSEQKIQVGSVTKTVLALGVLRLITEDKLTLDTNVELLLSKLTFYNPWRNSSPITVRHLLEHTAGIDNIRMWQLLSEQPTPAMPLIDAFISRDRHLLRVRTQPGTQYSYSNMGYTLLGMVIEAISNQPYEEYLDRNFLAPLGMDNSTFAFLSQKGEKADPSLAMGYFENQVAQSAVATFLRPSTQFTTTAPDMARFMRFIMAHGELDGVAFIRGDLMEMLAKPNATDAFLAGLNLGHGLAFAVRDRHKVVGMCHPGTTYGFRAYLCLYPNENKGFFWAVNTDSETADYERLNQIFIQKLAVSQANVIKPSIAPDNLSEFAGMYFLSPNNMAQFEFIDRLLNFIWLKSDNGELILSSLQAADRRLFSLGDGLFRDKSRTQASHVIFHNETGDTLLSDGLNTFKKGSAKSIIFVSVRPSHLLFAD